VARFAFFFENSLTQFLALIEIPKMLNFQAEYTRGGESFQIFNEPAAAGAFSCQHPAFSPSIWLPLLRRQCISRSGSMVCKVVSGAVFLGALCGSNPFAANTQLK
jgi:hypothetical protein